MGSYQWLFETLVNGVLFKLAITVDTSTESIQIESLSGSGDINALWLDYEGGDDTTILSKRENALNMNGTGIAWDDVAILSVPGLGKEGTDKSTFIAEGEALSFSLDDLGFGSINDWSEVTFGVRATSVNGDGNVKLVDTSADEISAPGGGTVFVVPLAQVESSELKGAFWKDDGDGFFNADKDTLLSTSNQSSIGVALDDVDFSDGAWTVHFLSPDTAGTALWDLKSEATYQTLDLSGFGEDDAIILDFSHLPPPSKFVSGSMFGSMFRTLPPENSGAKGPRVVTSGWFLAGNSLAAFAATESQLFTLKANAMIASNEFSIRPLTGSPGTTPNPTYLKTTVLAGWDESTTISGNQISVLWPSINADSSPTLG